MHFLHLIFFYSDRRTSHEVRGLKCFTQFLHVIVISRTSHEVRGLKFRGPNIVTRANKSHLTRGAWIEIHYMAVTGADYWVAPHTRCVD